MKTTLVIQDGISQIVLTPENQTEKNILNLIESKKVETAIKVGNYSECQGGWIRSCKYTKSIYDPEDKIDSLMLVLREKE